METWRIFLLASGLAGCAASVVHGILSERYIVRPLRRTPRASFDPEMRLRFTGPLIHVSTFVWCLSGLILLICAVRATPQSAFAPGLFVTAIYAHAALVNLFTARGRHFGGWLMAAVGFVTAAGLMASMA